MYCQSCKESVFGECRRFGRYKTDNQLRSENFKCYKGKIFKVNRSYRPFTPDENIYLEEMTESEINEAIAHCGFIKKLRSGLDKGVGFVSMGGSVGG